MKNLELSSSKLPISNNKKCGKNTNYSKVEIISNKITEYFNLTKLSFFPLLLVSMGFILLMIPCFLLGSYNLHLLKFTSMYFLSSPILMVVTSSLHIATALLLYKTNRQNTANNYFHHLHINSDSHHCIGFDYLFGNVNG